MTLSELLRSALDRVDGRSRRSLARRLGVHHETVRAYENGRALPTEETIMKLCAITGTSIEEALLNLNIWRTEGSARAVYSRILAAWLAHRGTERAPLRARR